MEKKNIYTGDELLHDYDETLIHDAIKNMTLYNSLIYVGSRSFKKYNETYIYKVLNQNNNGETFDENNFLNKKEKWYKTKYSEFKLDYDNIWHIFRRKIKNSELIAPTVDVISKNTTQENDNSICYNEKTGKKMKIADCHKIYEGDRRIEQPLLIHNHTKNLTSPMVGLNYGSQIFYKLDRSHLKKSFVLNIKIQPENLDLMKNETIPLIKFLVIYLNFIFKEIVATSKFANNTYNKQVDVKFMDNSITPNKLFIWKNSKQKLTPSEFLIDGIYIQINARSTEAFEKSDVLELLGLMVNSSLQRSDFFYLKEELYRSVEFYKSSNPTHQALNWLYRLGFKYDIDYFNMTHSIKNIDIKLFNDFKKNIFEDIRFVSLAVGSINITQAKNYIQSIETTFVNYSRSLTETDQASRAPPIEKVPQSFIQAPYTKYGSYFIFEKNNIYKHSPDSSTLNVYFIGENNIYNQVNMKFITNIAGNIFFSYLRIKHQLGYSVKNKLLNINNNLMFYVYIQGSKKHPSYLSGYIDKAISNIKKSLQSIEETAFIKLKEVVYKMFTLTSLKLNLKKSFYWGVVLGHENIFDNNKVKDYIDRLSVGDLSRFIDKILEKKLSIQVANSDVKYENKEKEAVYIDEIDYFRKFAIYGNPIQKETDIDISVKPSLEKRVVAKEDYKQLN